MTLRVKNWFFEVTSTAVKRGIRFKNGDRPSESTFKDLIGSSAFKTESEDRAKLDTGAFKSENNGHVTLATDEQTKNNETQKSNRSIVVQPHQTTTIFNKKEVLDDFDDVIIESNFSDVVSRKDYILKLTTAFKNWLLFRLLPKGGETNNFLTKKSNDDFDVEWSEFIPPDIEEFIEESQKGQPGGVVPLDGEGKISPEFYDYSLTGIKKIIPETFSNAYLYTAEEGEEITAYPDMLLVSFPDTNTVTSPDFKLDDLASVKLQFNGNTLQIGQIQPDHFYLLVKSGSNYDVLGLPITKYIEERLRIYNLSELMVSGDLLNFDTNATNGSIPSNGTYNLPTDGITRQIDIVSKASWIRTDLNGGNVTGKHYLYSSTPILTRIDESVVGTPSGYVGNDPSVSVVIGNITHLGDGGTIDISFLVDGDQCNITQIKTNIFATVI